MENTQLSKMIRLLSHESFVSSAKLAKELQVSDKTMRKRIKEMNPLLEANGMRIESKRGKGYFLRILDEKGAEQIQMEDNEDTNALDKEIMWMLLNEKGYVSTDEIAEKLYASKQTVFLKINKMEHQLNLHGLTLERRPGYGMKVTGSEVNKRHCLVNRHLHPRSETYDRIEKCVHVCISNEEYHISDYAYRNLIEHIDVMLQRIQNKMSIQEEEMDKSVCIEDFILAMSRQLSIALEMQFHLKIPKSEVLYLSMQLSGKRYLGEEGNRVIDADIVDLANHMLATVKNSFQVDLSRDFDLLISLCNHLMMLKRRIELNVGNRNPLLKEIMRNFPLAYSMAQQSSMDIFQVFHAKIDPDEVGYIALIYALSLEKNQFDVSKKSILLVCSLGKSSAQFLAYKYATTFKDDIKLLHVTSLQELSTFNVKNYDYIFTTVPILEAMPIPVVKVGHFLDDIEISKLKKS